MMHLGLERVPPIIEASADTKYGWLEQRLSIKVFYFKDFGTLWN